MYCDYYFWCVLVGVLPNLSEAFYTLCSDEQRGPKESECLGLYFDPNDKDTNLSNFGLTLQLKNALSISMIGTPTQKWITASLKISQFHNQAESFCKIFENSYFSRDLQYNCLSFNVKNESEEFLLEFETKRRPKYYSKKIAFKIPGLNEKMPIFAYLDYTTTYFMELTVQKLPKTYNVTYYKVEVFKMKDMKEILQDMRLFRSDDDVILKHFTYNDEGSYFFAISIISPQCPEDLCPKIKTPLVVMERKGVKLVVGIVGASFILPFVLLIFHIVTRKYKSDLEEKIAIVYKPSFNKRHVGVVVTLGRVLQKLGLNLDLIDASTWGSTKQFDNPLNSATRVVYVSPPKGEDYDFDEVETAVKEAKSVTEICIITFEDYCVASDSNKHRQIKLMDDFQKFIEFCYASSAAVDPVSYSELHTLISEAANEANSLPTILVTHEDPQENDHLIP